MSSSYILPAACARNANDLGIMSENQDLNRQDRQEKRVRRARRRLGVRSPFFASLIQHMEVRLVPDASSLLSNASDTGPDEAEEWGAVAKEETIYLKGACASRLSDEELEGYLAHGLVHLAFLHAVRRGKRDPGRWEIGADIVANETVYRLDGPELVAGAVRAPDWADRNVEAIYALLGEEESSLENLLTFHGREGAPEDSLPGVHLLPDPDDSEELRNKWGRALRRAHMIAERAQGGDLPAGLERDYDKATESKVDWRRALRRFLISRRSDYSGLDRRKVHRGRYVRKLGVDDLRVQICCDTSGSITVEQLSAFMAEVRSVASSRKVAAQLWYNDADLEGPFDLHSARGELPNPVGGGGTDFRPFFSEALDQNPHAGPDALVYFTDGYGTFPSEPDISTSTLWVLTKEGRPTADVPFGKVIRLQEI